MRNYKIYPRLMLVSLSLVVSVLYNNWLHVEAATSLPTASEAPAKPAGPSAITLLSFSAKRTSDTSVEVNWQTGIEKDVFGYYLYRSTTGRRSDATRLNAELIPAKGQSGQGASYQFVDSSVEANTTYFYWLQEVDINGSLPEYGPVTVARVTIFAPFVAR